MDLYPGLDMYDSFATTIALLSEFDQLGEEYKFDTVDASADADTVCAHLKRRSLEFSSRIQRKQLSRFVLDLIERYAKSLGESHPNPIAPKFMRERMEITSHQHIAAVYEETGGRPQGFRHPDSQSWLTQVVRGGARAPAIQLEPERRH